MQKTLLYLAILAILGFGVYFFLFSGAGNVFGNSEAGFSVKDTAAIGRIFLADNGGKSVTLMRTDSGWRVNGHKALEPQVTYLLGTLAQQEPVTPVTAVQHNAVVRGLAGSHVKVEIYNKGGDKMRTFYVGGEVQGFGGTYMLMDGAKKPYVVNIPGYEGYLTPRYSPNESVWLDRAVFNVGANAITQVSVDYAFAPLKSFMMLRAGDSISVTLPPDMSALQQSQPFNARRARTYLTFFSRVSGEATVNGLPGLDSVLRSVPRMGTVSVQGKGYSQVAVLYFYPLNQRSKNLGTPLTDTASYYDADHYYAVINGGRDTVSVQVGVLEKVLRYGYEFYGEEKTQEPINKEKLQQMKL